MKQKIIWFMSLMLLINIAYAQEVEVKGVILDENKQPLPGASVIIEGTSSGTVSNFEGNYTIKVKTGDVLVYNFVGYVVQKHTITASQKLDIRFKLDSEMINDVVIVGYGVQKRAAVVGAISDVSGADLRKTGLTNLTQMVGEQLTGVFTEQQSGQPGADNASITIRGVSSFSDNSPLILIDGVVAAAGFSQIDPGEVASITVLKDASSTAIYGVLGANGVILITTRRGTENAPSISVSGSVTAKMVVDVPDQLSSYDVLMLGQEAYKNSGDYGSLRSQWYINKFNDPTSNPYAYPDVDWYDLMMKDVGWEENARVNVSGGTKFVKYFAAISYLHQGDILQEHNTNGYYDPAFKFDKYNFRTNLDFNLSPTTKLSTDISGRSELINAPKGDMGSSSFDSLFKHLNIAPSYLFPAYYPEQFLEEYPDPMDPDAGFRLSSGMKEDNYIMNPYAKAYYSGMSKTRQDVVDFQVSLSQDLNFITKGLTVSARYNYSTAYKYSKSEGYNTAHWLYDAESSEWRPESDAANYNKTDKAFRSSAKESYKSSTRNLYYEGKLNYNRKFGLSEVGFTGVFSRREKRTSVGSLPEFHEDWVGRLTYDYNEKYMIEGSAGYNGSEKFAPGKKFGFFPAGAIGWDISKEEFIAGNLPWINKLKVRYSMGKTGSESGSRFMFEEGWSSQNSKLGYFRYGYPMYNESTRYSESKIANADATWETAYKKNLGFDIALFNSDLSIKVDLFDEQREDMFVTLPMPSYYHPKWGNGKHSGGNVSAPPVNLGESKNHGIEIETKYSHTLSNGIRYSIGANATMADSRIIVKSDKPYAPDYQKDIGKPIGWMQTYYSNGYINTFEEAINAPEVPSGNQPGNYMWSDFNGDGKIDVNDKSATEHTNQPSVTYSFYTGFSYKDFDFRVRFFGKEGIYYTRAVGYYPNFNNEMLEAKTFHLDRWSPTNTGATYPAYQSRTDGAFFYQYSNQNTIDGSYIKLQNVSMSYNLRSTFLKNTLRVQNAKFSLSGQNLYSWSDMQYGDPEGGGSRGYGTYPLVKRIVFGVDLNF